MPGKTCQSGGGNVSDPGGFGGLAAHGLLTTLTPSFLEALMSAGAWGMLRRLPASFG